MTIVTTKCGTVRGIDVEGAIAWRGIPYARAPLGNLRWMPPQPVEKWDGVRDGSKFSARAMQIPTPELTPPAGDIEMDDPTWVSEDCLYLNICRPARIPLDQPLPVLVWIHGGGFHFGSGPDLIGDGLALVRKDVVVVTFNYRLGAFGFLDLSRRGGPEYAHSRNCGMLDQIAALRWIQENIGAFGGDPGRVTIAGVSAGAKSVINLMVSPLARGLFQRAISQSGGDHVATAEDSAKLADLYFRRLAAGDKSIASLLHVPAEELLQSQRRIAAGVRSTWVWRPAIDESVLPMRPLEAFAKGASKGIPLLAGVTQYEARAYDIADPSSVEQVPRVFAQIFNDEAESVTERYRHSRPELGTRDVMRIMMSDERYNIPTIQLLERHQAHTSCWRYRFDGPTPGFCPQKRGAHGAECGLIWGVGTKSADEATRRLADDMQSAWASFIYGNAPQAASLPEWPPYDTEWRAVMLLDVFSSVALDPEGDERRLWDGVVWQPGTWWDLE